MSNLPSTFSFVDVETTGTNPIGDRVIEIGIIRVEDGQVVDSLNTLVNPEVYIPEEITYITGITQNDVEKAPYFREIKDRVIELLAESVFVAHNARFDYGFVKNELMRHELRFNSKVLCTVRLARALFPTLPRFGLDSIISHFELQCPNRHRAYDDAHALWQFYQKVMTIDPQDKVVEALDKLLKTPSLPAHLTAQDIDSLPESPGVYLFYGEDNMVLYIGKSINVRDRVLSHFSSDYLSRTDLKLREEVRRIEVIETAGDFSASIKESHLIKSMQPIHNRMLRHSQDLIAIEQTESGDGALQCRLTPVHTLERGSISSVLGVFRSYKQAKEYIIQFAKEYKLCLRVLGLEKGKGACFNYQIGKCLGACCGEESILSHNVRFIEVFGGKKVPRWPYEGAVGIKEKSFTKEEVHIVDNWCYIGTLSESSDIESAEVRFDWDVYKILKRHLQRAKDRNILSFSVMDKISL